MKYVDLSCPGEFVDQTYLHISLFQSMQTFAPLESQRSLSRLLRLELSKSNIFLIRASLHEVPSLDPELDPVLLQLACLSLLLDAS